MSVNIKQTKKSERWMYLLMFVLIYITDSGIINFGGITWYYLSMLCVLAFATVGALRFFSNNGLRVPVKFIVVCYLLFCISAFSYLLGTGIGPILKYDALILLGFFIALDWDFRDFACKFSNVCFFLAVISLVLFIVVAIRPEVYDMLPSIHFTSSGTEREYKTVFFANMIRFGTQLPRLYGPFWEPGVCQAYFNIALLFSSLYLDEKKQLLRIVVFTAAIIATQSTTGYFACAFILSMVIFKRNQGGKNAMVFIKIFIVAAIFIGIWNLPSLMETKMFETTFSKFDTGMENASVSSRYLSAFGNFSIALRSPIYGVGLNNSDGALRSLYSNYIGIHQTNTLTNYFATFGFILGVFMNVMWISFVRKISLDKITGVLCLGAIVAILSGENFLNSACMNIFLMYGFLALNKKSSNSNQSNREGIKVYE